MKAYGVNVEKRGKCWILSYDCRECWDRKKNRPIRHEHGGGPSDQPPVYGHRSGHWPHGPVNLVPKAEGAEHPLPAD